jgi:hypothetical protein
MWCTRSNWSSQSATTAAIASAGGDLEVGGDRRQGITIEEPQVDGRSGCGEVGEDRALVDAVAAPGAGQHEHGHAADEAAEQGPLGGGQRDPPMKRLPPLPLVGSGMTVEEALIGQRHGEGSRPSLGGGRRAGIGDRGCGDAERDGG